MSTHQATLELRTRGAGLSDVTRQIAAVVEKSGIVTGTCTVFVQHTSASLVIQENADPAVLRDLERWLADLAPESRPWEHDAEGPDDMPAHAKSAVLNSSETIPVSNGRLSLGTWQAIYLFEHRTAAHTRRLVVTVHGD
jgi:secondary thiamine-phosphate synthase enzyme